MKEALQQVAAVPAKDFTKPTRWRRKSVGDKHIAVVLCPNDPAWGNMSGSVEVSVFTFHSGGPAEMIWECLFKGDTPADVVLATLEKA